MTPDSTGILAVASVGVIICGQGASHLAPLTNLVVPDYSTPHDPGFDWNSCCGLGKGDNLSPRSLSSGSSMFFEMISSIYDEI